MRSIEQLGTRTISKFDVKQIDALGDLLQFHQDDIEKTCEIDCNINNTLRVEIIFESIIAVL
ncbi:MAG: hypothetical protein Q4G09_07535 [Clostridia bacterium]|nr:hypothetical protein [Clostridia bacterium]